MMTTSMMTVSKTITSSRFPCIFVSLTNDVRWKLKLPAI
jgi:hypothetical protein